MVNLWKLVEAYKKSNTNFKDLILEGEILRLRKVHLKKENSVVFETRRHYEILGFLVDSIRTIGTSCLGSLLSI